MTQRKRRNHSPSLKAQVAMSTFGGVAAVGEATNKWNTLFATTIGCLLVGALYHALC